MFFFSWEFFLCDNLKCILVKKKHFTINEHYLNVKIVHTLKKTNVSFSLYQCTKKFLMIRFKSFKRNSPKPWQLISASSPRIEPITFRFGGGSDNYDNNHNDFLLLILIICPLKIMSVIRFNKMSIISRSRVCFLAFNHILKLGQENTISR